ncbi:hypothetical protein D9619_011952 [Psilocybe cf. subviscida]|uniref:Nephrocystin 3-like N-terminal domain-containing protein n=1 Tax=Psilocybe cf. subviscida TaxID=2480587 RepID=A0A8H5EW40_9AGAR|nr:hypothetical protein D9619_011952 [Psilocybe cf. subviscida]
MSQPTSDDSGARRADPGMSLFPGTSGIHSNNSTIITNGSGGTDKKKRIADAMALLESHTEKGAPYDAVARRDNLKCPEHTRVAIIEGICTWAHSQETDACPLMWIYGSTGTGKTAIMQIVAEIFDKEGSLAGSFFFSRLPNARPRQKANFIITMGHQLLLCIPALQQTLANTLSDPSILTKSLTKQLDLLMINPLKTLDPAQVGPRFIFLVDGLDACKGDAAQREVLDLLERLLDEVPHRIRILVASQAHSHIQPFFVQASIRDRTQTTPLDNGYQSNKDILQYFVSEFEGIRGEHPAHSQLPSEWPPRSDIDVLVKRASGQVIYASVVMKFIADHGRHPDESLQTIIRSKAGGNAGPYRELDAAYAQVLSTIEPQHLEFVYTLMGCLVLRRHKYCFAKVAQTQATAQVDSLFMIPAGTTASCTNCISPLITVGSHGMKFSDGSFPDYLLDRSRSKEFFLDMPKFHGRLARMWFESYSTHFKHHPRKGIADAGPASYELQQYRSVSLPRDVIAHCLEAEWTPELQQYFLTFDLQTALSTDPPADLVTYRNFDWKPAFLWVGFTFWLEQKHLQSTAHTEFLRGCIQSWLPLPQISHPDRRVIASVLTWYNHTGTLLLEDGPWTNKDSSLEAHSALIEAFADLPANFKDVQEAVCIWICRILVPDAAMDGALFSNGDIYTEMILRYMDDSESFDRKVLKVLCKASPAEELSTRLNVSLQMDKSSLESTAESAIKSFLGPYSGLMSILRSDSDTDEDEDEGADVEKELMLLICIYLFECGIPYISQHRHAPEFDMRKNWFCPICLVFDPFKEESADIELSRDPPGKPDAVPTRIADEQEPQFLQIGQVRQFIPGVPLPWLQAWVFWFADMMIRFFPVVA